MSDELVIRHVRLCECGKPAGHASVCRPSRLAIAQKLDDDWLEARARQREEKHAKRERTSDAGRRTRRARLNDTLALHHSAIERATALSTVAAGSLERSRGGSASSGEPPAQQTFDDDPRWREHWRVITSRLLRVHELLDEATGHGTVTGSPVMIRAEKQRRVIEDGRGLTPIGVVEELGHYLAGSPETVRRDRREAGVCMKTGFDAPYCDTKNPCVVCRHARQPRPNCDCGICRHDGAWNMPSSAAFVPVPKALRDQRKAADLCLRDGQAPRSGCPCIVCRQHWPTG